MSPERKMDDSGRPVRGLPRRGFFRATVEAGKLAVGAGAVFGAGRLSHRTQRTRVAPAAQSPVRPPGAVPEPEFLQRCIGCYLCGQVCPPGCIEFPAEIVGADVTLRRARTGFERAEPEPPSWSNPGTPYILPWTNACTLCMACPEVCPTGALVPLAPSVARPEESVRMGRAVVDEKICLPFNRVSWCGACYTACPLKETAIKVDYKNRPTVLEGCVGCGLCVEACPIRYKAIAIRPPFRPNRGEVRGE